MNKYEYKTINIFEFVECFNARLNRDLKPLLNSGYEIVSMTQPINCEKETTRYIGLKEYAPAFSQTFILRKETDYGADMIGKAE